MPEESKSLSPISEEENNDKLAYKLIPLTRGMVAAVSPEDFERVSAHRWYTSISYGRPVATTSINRLITYLSRFIFGLQPRDEKEVDHWNTNTLDNRRCNLRVCSRSQNSMNRSKPRHKRGRFKGVCKGTSDTAPKPFYANIYVEGENVKSKFFATEEEAALEYDRLARLHYGEFARLNFPRPEELPPPPPSEVAGQTVQPTDRFSEKRGRVSSYIGVSLLRGKWRWRIGGQGQHIERWGFSTDIEAAMRRDDFILENKLPNRLNFPNEKGEGT